MRQSDHRNGHAEDLRGSAKNGTDFMVETPSGTARERFSCDDREMRSATTSDLSHDDPLVHAFVAAACRAGDLAMRFFRPGETTSAAVMHKLGGSPVTEADEAVNVFLEGRLRKLVPDAAWLSEESADSPERLGCDLVLVIDPIDGTRGFVAGRDGWAVSMALLIRSRPVLGVIHAPALRQTYVAVAKCGARLNGAPIGVSPRLQLAPEATAVGAPSLAQKLRRAGVAFDLLPKVPSLALRIAFVAKGEIDAALIKENSQDWDIAAADLVLTEAGGRLANPSNDVPIYNRADTSHGVLIAASPPIFAQIAPVLASD
jgi:myo-inositol-1(or 4)-monophosphatase